MRSEIVNLANNNLSGDWHHADSHKHLIIICHGYQGSSEDPTIVAIAKGLNEKGHDTFTFNFSENTGGFDIEHQVDDITHIVNRFSDYDELILLAGSLAALTGVIATLKLPNIKALITLNGFFGKGDVGQKHRRIYLLFRFAALVVPKYRKILKYFRRELQPDSIKVPVLVVHSKADRYVFIKQSQDFYKELRGPKRFVTLGTANHGITSPADRRKIVREIDEWLDTKQELLRR